MKENNALKSSEKYPKSLGVDFRKLPLDSLRTYIARYRISARPLASQLELAVLVARHFEAQPVDEEAIIARFFEHLDGVGDGGRFAVDDGDGIAKVSEQVAAKVTMVDENGSWILASVVEYDSTTDAYEVQDEDDASKKIFLPAARIRRLECADEALHELQKGDRVLAIFPETTSFYRAVVSKTPKRTASGALHELVLKFEDDEDDAGRTPHRRVALRYVLRETRPSRSAAVTRRAPAPAPVSREVRVGGEARVDRWDEVKGRSASWFDASSDQRTAAAAGTAATYSDMIAHALQKLPQEQGSFKDICAVIEDDFSDQLNWKLESDLRKTPVWKSSVRKILFSNSRFCHASALDKSVFGFA